MRHDVRPEATLELLLEVMPLVRLLRGEKRARLQRTIISVVNGAATAALGQDSAIPPTPRQTIEQLLRLMIQLARQDGMTAMDLLDFFNACADAGDMLADVDPAGRIVAASALLTMLEAHRLPGCEQSRVSA